MGGVPESLHALQIAAGSSHTCALIEGSEVWCWGSDSEGQLGDGIDEYKLVPRPVLQFPGGPPLTGVEAVAAGANHTCALMFGGELRCWGENSHGQLGDGTDELRRSPVSVLQTPGGPPLTGVLAVALGVEHSCVQLSGGEVRCWGDNFVGQLGAGAITLGSQLTPVQILQTTGQGAQPLVGVEALAAGGGHNCVLMPVGELRCWGADAFDQLGHDENHLLPAPVVLEGGQPLAGVRAAALGITHSCALTTEGKVACWGANYFGQLGHETSSSQATPEFVAEDFGGPSLRGAEALFVGGNHNCVMIDGGRARCWGNDDFRQLGNGLRDGNNTRPFPVPVVQAPGGRPLDAIRAMALGVAHSCALLADGEVRCWGSNLDGRVGDGTEEDRPTPVSIAFRR